MVVFSCRMGEIVVRFQMGIYSIYRLVLKSLNDLLCKVYSAFTGSVGNLGATEDGEYIYKIYKQLDFFHVPVLRLHHGGIGDAV